MTSARRLWGWADATLRGVAGGIARRLPATRGRAGTPPVDAPRGVRARTAALYTRDIGDGPTVVLLHAFPLSSRMWEPQVRALEEGVRLVAPDLPGLGLSAASPGRSLDDHAHAVAATLETLGIERPFLAGISMGGYVALRLVDLLGDRCEGLLLADTRADADSAEVASARHELAAEVEARGVETAAGALLPRMIGATTLSLRPRLVDEVRSMIMENAVPGTAAALRAMAARPDATALLPRITCPVVCLAGEEDELTPPAVAYAMAARIPRGRAVTIPGAGHLTNLETPHAFNAALTGLVAESLLHARIRAH